jgi:ABC-type Mn2+/Zn2+ transport system permease subunit/Mn-dependent DtxR family transcriptional regulator
MTHLVGASLISGLADLPGWGVLAGLDLQLHWASWAEPFTAMWWQATVCSVLVGIACGVLGCFVVLRQMALIGDALSHSVLPGVVIAFMVTGSTGVGGLLLGALLAGLVTSVLINVVGRFGRTKEDSAIGIVFTALFALGIILISMQPRGTHFDLKCFLFGDPLAVGSKDVRMMGVIAPVVLLTVFLLYHRLKLASFDPVVAKAMGIGVMPLHYLLMALLSVTVVAGLNTTGVVLVVAMVITPASAAYQLTNRLWAMLLLAGVFGATSAVVGLSLAFVVNAPTGPAMVLVATLLFTLTVVFAPQNGVVARTLRRRRTGRHLALEDVLKALHRAEHEDRVGDLGYVAGRAQMSQGRLQRMLQRLRRDGMVSGAGSGIALTEAGRTWATELVRSHRLWETYLAEGTGLDQDDVHHEAEYLEHAHDLAEHVAEALGHPTVDPHGSIIPEAMPLKTKPTRNP